MTLLNNNFLTFGGKPVTGRVPTQLIVIGPPLTREQHGAIAHAYKLFCDAAAVSMPEYLVQNRTLPDGTQVRMEHTPAADRVIVTTQEGAQRRFSLLPAFWYDAPAVDEAMPAPPNVGTWTNLPYRAAALTSIQNFWQTHPGNRSWRNSRADSTTKGLVLSWWGLGKDRYNADAQEPAAAVDFDYNKLYCNGTRIYSFGSSQAVLGACICEVAGVKTIAAVVADWADFDYGMTGDKIRSISDASATIDVIRSDDEGALTISGIGLTLKTYHASLPSDFMRGNLRACTFTLLATTVVCQPTGTSPGEPFTRDGDDYAFYPIQHPDMPPSAGILFNSQGTEGVLNITGRAYGYPSGDFGARTIMVWGLRIDPATGSLGEAVTAEVTDTGETSASDPGGYLTALWGFTVYLVQALPCPAFDYEDGTGMDDDALVWTALRSARIDDNVDGAGGMTQRAVIQHSRLGILLYDSYENSSPSTGPGDPATIEPSDNAVTGRTWRMTGDLRSALMHWRGKGDGVSFTDTIIKSWLDTTALSDVTPAAGYEPTHTGYEGADSSFDLHRMTVSRFGGVVRVYVDGADVTTTVDDANLPDAKYPLLCGPFAWEGGKIPTRPTAYVAGDPP